MVVPPGGGLRTHTHTNVEATRRTGPFSFSLLCWGDLRGVVVGLVGCGGEEKCVIEEGGICDGEAKCLQRSGWWPEGEISREATKGDTWRTFEVGGWPNWIERGRKEEMCGGEWAKKRKGFYE